MEFQDKSVAKAVAQALGLELRRAREEQGLSRAQFIARLPSGICERTLMSYEHSTRQLSVVRLLELCQGLGVPASSVLNVALQQARLFLENLVLQVDLHALLSDQRSHDLSLVQWACNKLNRHPDGIVELAPAAVLELADFLGYDQSKCAAFLSTFTPDAQITYGFDKTHVSVE